MTGLGNEQLQLCAWATASMAADELAEISAKARRHGPGAVVVESCQRIEVYSCARVWLRTRRTHERGVGRASTPGGSRGRASLGGPGRGPDPRPGANRVRGRPAAVAPPRRGGAGRRARASPGDGVREPLRPPARPWPRPCGNPGHGHAARNRRRPGGPPRRRAGNRPGIWTGCRGRAPPGRTARAVRRRHRAHPAGGHARTG